MGDVLRTATLRLGATHRAEQGFALRPASVSQCGTDADGSVASGVSRALDKYVTESACMDWTGIVLFRTRSAGNSDTRSVETDVRKG